MSFILMTYLTDRSPTLLNSCSFLPGTVIHDHMTQLTKKPRKMFNFDRPCTRTEDVMLEEMYGLVVCYISNLFMTGPSGISFPSGPVTRCDSGPDWGLKALVLHRLISCSPTTTNKVSDNEYDDKTK